MPMDRDGEALDRADGDPVEDQGGDEGSQVGVKNRREGLVVCGGDGGAQRFAGGALLP